MRLRFLLLILVFPVFFKLSAQSQDMLYSDSCSMTSKGDTYIKEELKPNRNLFVEIGGPSYGVGVGYDQRFKHNSALGFRIGLAYTNFMRVACAFLAGSAKCSPIDGLVISPNLALGYTIR